MLEPTALLSTENFYKWEERGRGWMLYDFPVEIEPPFEPFIQPPFFLKERLDDGRSESFFDKVKRGVNEIFQPSPKDVEKMPEEPPIFSYPESPVPCHAPTETVTYRIKIPKGFEVHFDEAEKLLHVLAYSKHPFAFEILGTSEAIHIQWSCKREDKERLVAQLRAYFPLLAITAHDAFDIPFTEKANIAIADLGLKEEFMRPLATVTKFSPDPLIGITAILEQLHFEEIGMVQILFQGSMNSWSGAILNSVTDGTGKSFFVDAPEMPKLAHDKVSSPLYGVVVRVIAQGEDSERSEHIAEELIQSLLAHSRSEYNILIPLSNEGYSLKQHLLNVFERRSNRLGMILNSKELVSFAHIPSISVASQKLSRQAVKTKALPRELSSGIYELGLNLHLGQEKKAFLTDEHRLRHMHVIGSTGVGKSTLLTQLLLQDIQHGNGCAILDPHGDTIDDVINRIPENRLDDVLLIDPSDTEFPIGLNLLHATTDIEKIVLSSDLVDTFKARSTSWGDTMTSVLANAINAFLENEDGGTLLELRRFLLDGAFRKQYLSRVSDSGIISYWQHDFPQLRKGSLSPLLTRLDTFLRPKIIRNMMAQKQGIDFNEVLSKKKILLIKLAQGLIGEDNSYLLGTLILAKMYQAAQARQSISKGERAPFYVYIDEFHHFITPSLAGILSGARKYGFGLVLAHQELNQVMSIDSNVGNSIISNPGVRICFRLGDYDATKLETGFQYFDSSDLQNLGIGEAVVRVGRSDYDFNIVTKKLPDVFRTNNLSVIYDNSRKKYATPKREVEKWVDELLKPEEKQIEEKEKPETIESKKETLTTSEEDSKEKEFSHEVIAETKRDITKASEEYVENVERQREIKEHRYLQEFIKKMAEERGFKAIIEEPTTSGGRVDVGLMHNDIRIACEISISNTVGYEIQNIQKCLDEGYTLVYMISNNVSHLQAIQIKATEIISKEFHNKLLFVTQDEFTEHLNTFVAHQKQPEEKTIKGYRVKVNYLAADNAQNQRQMLHDALLSSIRKKKLE